MSLQEVWVARGRRWDLATSSSVNPKEVVLETLLQLLKFTWRGGIHEVFYIPGVVQRDNILSNQSTSTVDKMGSFSASRRPVSPPRE